MLLGFGDACWYLRKPELTGAVSSGFNVRTDWRELERCKMKMFVTGCAGFIGSSLVDRLLTEGHSVVGIDDFSTGQRRFLESALQHDGFRLIEADLLDLDGLKVAMHESEW